MGCHLYCRCAAVVLFRREVMQMRPPLEQERFDAGTTLAGPESNDGNVLPGEAHGWREHGMNAQVFQVWPAEL